MWRCRRVFRIWTDTTGMRFKIRMKYLCMFFSVIDCLNVKTVEMFALSDSFDWLKSLASSNRSVLPNGKVFSGLQYWGCLYSIWVSLTLTLLWHINFSCRFCFNSSLCKAEQFEQKLKQPRKGVCRCHWRWFWWLRVTSWCCWTRHWRFRCRECYPIRWPAFVLIRLFYYFGGEEHQLLFITQ